MTSNLFWKTKVKADQKLPLVLKWAIENNEIFSPSIEWLKGFCAALESKNCDSYSEESLELNKIYALISSMEQGNEIEFEWR